MSQKYPVIILRPHRLQIVAGNMGRILCLALFLVLAGWDGLLPESLFPFLMTAAAILLANLLCKYLYLSCVRYTINEEQLQYEYGIFSIQRDYIELYRVVDYSEQRSFQLEDREHLQWRQDLSPSGCRGYPQSDGSHQGHTGTSRV